MGHITPIRLDPGVNQPIEFRRACEATLIFRFKDAAGNDYAIEDDFRFSLYKESRDKRNPLINITNTDELVIDGNEIQVPFDEENSDIDRRTCYYELKNLTTKKNWLQGEATVLSGEAPDTASTSEVERTINLGDNVISVTVSVGGGAFDISQFDPSQLTTQQKVDLVSVLIDEIRNTINDGPLSETADSTAYTADSSLITADNT